MFIPENTNKSILVIIIFLNFLFYIEKQTILAYFTTYDFLRTTYDFWPTTQPSIWCLDL